MHDHPRLLLVAHGTESPAGSATTLRLRDAVRAARPSVSVDLCFLDVVEPRLAGALDGRATVLVPLLLSTGYHVQTDIPALVAPYPATRVTAHLGPDPLVITCLLARLAEAHRGAPARSTVLVAAGSSRPEAALELAQAARLLGTALGRDIGVLTMADDLRAALSALPEPIDVATYLLAEGRFVTTLCDAADGIARVAAPLGVHPALVELIWNRYDSA